VQGKISFKNLKRVAKELGENMTDEELQEMIDEADRDGDGEVSEEEFIKCVLACAGGTCLTYTCFSHHSGLCERRPCSVPTEGMRRRELLQTDEMTHGRARLLLAAPQLATRRPAPHPPQ